MRLILSLPFACALLSAELPIQPSATLFENDQVKVLRAVEKPHVKGKPHEHKANRVMIYLQSGRQSFEYQDGRKPAVFDWKAGQVEWSPASGMHAPEVVSDSPFNIVEVELKKPGAGKSAVSAHDAVKVDPKQFKVEIDNDQVRVLRVKVGPHQKNPMHDHALNRVTVFLTDADVRITDAAGKVETVHRKAGDAVWATPSMHQEENLGDKPTEAVLIEVKS